MLKNQNAHKHLRSCHIYVLDVGGVDSLGSGIDWGALGDFSVQLSLIAIVSVAQRPCDHPPHGVVTG